MRCLDDMLAQTCEACHRPFETMQGLISHQSTSRKCAWYKKGKRRELLSDTEDSISSDDDVSESENEHCQEKTQDRQ